MKKILVISIGVMLVFGLVRIANGDRESREKERVGQEVSPAKPDLPEEASEKAKVKVEKVWERKFDEEIEDFSVTNDGRKILVSLRNGDKHFISRSGKVIKRQKGKRGRALKNGRFITIDGEILDSNGNIDSKIRLVPPDIEYPISSTQGRYIAVVPGYDADFPFLKVYDTKKGNLLWEYQKGKEGEVYGKAFMVVAKFIDDKRLAVYSEGIISMYGIKSGNKIWEINLSREDPRVLEYEEFELIQLTTSQRGDIVICYRSPKGSFLYSLSGSGIIKWKKEGEKNIGFRYAKISNDGKLLIATGRETLYLLDCQSGNTVWKRWIVGGGQIEFGEENKYLFIADFLYEEEKRGKRIKGKELGKINSRFYTIDSASGMVIDRIVTGTSLSKGGVKFGIFNKGRNIVIKDKNNLKFLNISQ